MGSCSAGESRSRAGGSWAHGNSRDNARFAPSAGALALPAVSMARGALANGRARRTSRAPLSWRPLGPAGAALPRRWSRPGEKALSPRAPAARAAPAAPPAPRCLRAPSKGRTGPGAARRPEALPRSRLPGRREAVGPPALWAVRGGAGLGRLCELRAV